MEQPQHEINEEIQPEQKLHDDDEPKLLPKQQNLPKQISQQQISAKHFYNSYYGHKMPHIELLYKHFKKLSPKSSIVFLAGDSSLDNKHWIIGKQAKDATYGYDTFLVPPLMVRDICYNLSNSINKKGIHNTFVLNCAVEEATIGNKKQYLNSQDKFILSRITSNDILVVSIGGNDMALNPTISTMWNMFKLVTFNGKEYIKNTPHKAWGIDHFIELFKDGITAYIAKLINLQTPRKVIVCTIYYPDKTRTGSWADDVLGKLGYDSDPEKLQLIIQHIHKEAICKIKIPGVDIVPLALYTALDGNISSDYVARVEPSETGGEKIADVLANLL